MTQNQWILSRLKKGSLTQKQAYDAMKCFRLASRINELRQAGHNIETRRKTLKSGARIAEYFLS